MHELPFLADLVVILFAAVLIILVSRPLRIHSIVGFLLTGVLIGPSGLNIVTETSVIEAFAEIGVVLLLFVIGLEFSFSRLKSMWRQILIAGGLQVLITTGVVIALSEFLDFSAGQRVFFGFLVALSSTAIVLKLLADQSEIDTPHGKLMIGILLFQDFCIVPMIVLTPFLSGQEGVSPEKILFRLGLSIVAIALIFLIARPVLARAFEQIVRTRVREAFLLGSLLICLLLSVATASLGFSYALGAFIAGLLVSETQYHLEVGAEITSFRDLFTSLFFISIGMLLNRSFILDNLATVLILGMGILVVKPLVVFPIALLLKSSPRTAIISSLSLAQVGEFSFVLAQVGFSVGLMDESFNQHFLGASILSMLISPLVISLAPSVAERTHHLVPLGAPDDSRRAVEVLEDHVIIAGFGVIGRSLVGVLKETGIPHVVVETDADSMYSLRKTGSGSVFGDITRKDILERCNIARARLVVFTISDPAATRTSVRLTRAMNPEVHIIVRTRLVAEVDGLILLGANEVIPEEFETSIEIFTRVLDHYHIPRNVINAQIQIIRDENYSMLRDVPQTARGLDRVARYLTAGTSDTFLVTDSCRSSGQLLGELDISGKTGASLIAVVRNEKPFVTPPPEFRVEPGDILVLVGNHASMDRAFQYLSKTVHNE